ncbi:glycerate kinase [Evansella vedderi]|uniref:Glycerate kinase n=1 Tax=Evansella vedderi TaxID=38282 RepID=A0ABT9ZSE4_9BACI|nr:glycerate kinase [Evansella vedderi]MDQ0254144.1 glycerate kinase [Evansella vedderi]
MKIVIAPDSFKGSLSAPLLCEAISKGVKNIIPDVEILKVPLADGGEGTMENLVYSTGGKIIEVNVNNPLMIKVKANYGILGDGETVVIEMAQASGLPLLTKEQRNPMKTSSYGTGELIEDALERGYKKFIIGIGGSATNDGGAGMLEALGVKFFDQEGIRLERGGANLSRLAYFEEENMHPKLKEAEFVIASDVKNPLCGPDGASTVFGPQKGATSEMVEQLDNALKNYANIILKQKKMNIMDVPGAGAAGGMGAALLVFFNGKMKSGIDIVLDAVNFKKKLENTDLLITGEGKLDTQTLSGKVIAGVCKIANKSNVPVIALCGGSTLNGGEIKSIGLHAAFSIVKGPCDLDYAIENTKILTEEKVEELIKLLKIGIDIS